MQRLFSIITGTGSYLPKQAIDNDYFQEHSFYFKGQPLSKPTSEVIDHIEKITEIKERRYIDPELNTSDIAYYAGKAAIQDAGIDKEELDYIIVAHNFGDVADGNRHSDMVPSLASRVKYKLGIENPQAVAYDVIFGCPGWIQGLIQADYFIRSGDARKVLVIGAEALSRVSDPNDRDCMLYSDGAGAVIVEAHESNRAVGILGHQSRTDAFSEQEMLWMDTSNKGDADDQNIYLKMNGRNVYRYAMAKIPDLVFDLLKKQGIHLSQIKKVLIHQANAKMVKSILQKMLERENLSTPVTDLMPLTISWLGNNSVATVPILLDLLLKHEIERHQIAPNDLLLFCSVGAGMNINAVLYRVPG